MSHFLRDRLQIGIEPGKVSLVRLPRLGRRRILDCATYPCPEGDSAAGAVAVLATELPSPRWQGTRVRIVISDLLARYLVAPVPEGARTIGELQDAARLRFEDIYGDDAALWTLRIDPAPWTPNHLGCALPKVLVDGLSGACQKASLPVDAIVPFGISEFNRHHHFMGLRSGWFVAVGAGSVWMALKSGAGWLHVQTRRLAGDGLASLPQWLAQGQLRAGLAKSPATDPRIAGLIGATGRAAVRNGFSRALCPDAVLWPGREDQWSADYRLALSSVWPRCA